MGFGNLYVEKNIIAQSLHANQHGISISANDSTNNLSIFHSAIANGINGPLENIIYRWIVIYRGTTADHHCSMRSERNDQGTSVLGQVGPYCAWFPSIPLPADFKGPLELENLKKSPDGQVPIWGVKTRK